MRIGHDMRGRVDGGRGGASSSQAQRGYGRHVRHRDEARRILTTRDDFIRALSPFDRAARVKTDKDVSEKEFLRNW